MRFFSSLFCYALFRSRKLCGTFFVFSIDFCLQDSDLSCKSRCHDMTAGLVRIRSGRAAAPGGLPSCCMMLHRRGCLRMLCHVVLFRRICHSPRREAYIASGTGISRLWQGCPIPAAPWLVRLTSAAGIPLKSVGGRSWGCVSPALSSRPMLPGIGSKAA